jgi:hypothetical protein
MSRETGEDPHGNHHFSWTQREAAVAVMTKEALALRGEVQAAVLSEVEAVGIERFSKAAIVRPFLGKCSQATLYRWISEFMASGNPGQHIVRKVREAAAARAVLTPDPVADVVEAIRVRLPEVVRIEDVGAGSTTVGVIQRLEDVIANVEMLVRHAKTDDGKIRNARLMLLALAELRKCLETSVKFYQAMREIDQIDRLHTVILEEIGKQSPELAEQILLRIDAIAGAWSG